MSLLLSLRNYPGICAANIAAYPPSLKATFPHFRFEEEVMNNFGRTILSLLLFQLLELPAGILLSALFRTQPRAAVSYSAGFVGIHISHTPSGPRIYNVTLFLSCIVNHIGIFLKKRGPEFM